MKHKNNGTCCDICADFADDRRARFAVACIIAGFTGLVAIAIAAVTCI